MAKRLTKIEAENLHLSFKMFLRNIPERNRNQGLTCLTSRGLYESAYRNGLCTKEEEGRYKVRGLNLKFMISEIPQETQTDINQILI